MPRPSRTISPLRTRRSRCSRGIFPRSRGRMIRRCLARARIFSDGDLSLIDVTFPRYFCIITDVLQHLSQQVAFISKLQKRNFASVRRANRPEAILLSAVWAVRANGVGSSPYGPPGGIRVL